MQNVMMNNGTMLHKEKISKLVGFIIDKFADEELSVDEGKVVLKEAEDIIGEFSKVVPYKFLSNISCKE